MDSPACELTLSSHPWPLPCDCLDADPLQSCPLLSYTRHGITPSGAGAAGARPNALGHCSFQGILVSGDSLPPFFQAPGGNSPQSHVDRADRTWATPSACLIIWTDVEPGA
jgi:hypothetical protein